MVTTSGGEMTGMRSTGVCAMHTGVATTGVTTTGVGTTGVATAGVIGEAITPGCPSVISLRVMTSFNPRGDMIPP